jgi:ABC-type molybdenum transport system ATPase subunit/photorepair protein PhrA
MRLLWWLLFVYHSDAFHTPQPIQSARPFRAVADDFAENKGDARGAALLLEDVSVFRGPNEILNKISWRVEPNTKWAVRVE